MYNFKGDFETVYTGENDISQSGLLETYRGSTHLPQWEGYCGSIQNASDGTKFRGGVTPNDTQIFYRKSLCRAKPMVILGFWREFQIFDTLNFRYGSIRLFRQVLTAMFTNFPKMLTITANTTRKTNVSAKPKNACLLVS